MAELDRDTWSTIVDSLRSGNYLETAAALAGVDIRTVRRWIREGASPDSPYEAFRADVLRAEAESESQILRLIVDQAETGDAKAAQWILERRHPDRWSLRVQHIVGEQLSAAVARVEALEPTIGREAVEVVLGAIAGGDIGGSSAGAAEADLH